jgi:hypothetical protein
MVSRQSISAAALAAALLCSGPVLGAVSGTAGPSSAGRLAARSGWPPPVQALDQMRLPAGVGTEVENPKLTWQLADLAAAGRSAAQRGTAITATDLSGLPPGLRALADAGRMRFDAGGAVQIYVHPAAGIDAAIAAVQHAGGRVERSSASANLVQAMLPVSALESLAADAAVELVRLPDYGHTQAGSVTSEGDQILEASLVRSTFGVNGTGVRVGIISDGVGGLAQSQASGDLPASVDTTTCNVAGGSPQSSGSEGTAMMEIVHDLAPGAQLWFGHFNTGLEFNDAVACLAANTDVAADDISFLNEGPYDGTSYISANTAQQLNNTGNRIRAYSTAVGNFAQEHYREAFRDSGFTLRYNHHTYRLHQFAATARTTDAGQGLSCATGSNVQCGNAVMIASGASFSVFLEWDDPFNASSNDYDLFLFDATTGNLVAVSHNVQNGHQNPTESLSWTNIHADGLFYFVIGLRAGAAKNLSVFVPDCSHGSCLSFPNNTDLNFNTVSRSIANEGDAGGGVLSVGAIDAADPNNVDIEPYSSHGPTLDGRTKPDITGIDGVKVTGVDGFGSPFYGTSAATPHIAGIEALMLQLLPDLATGGSTDATTARGILHDTVAAAAFHLGAAGVNNTFGFGRANAYATAELLTLPAGPCAAAADTLCIDDVPGDRRWLIKVLYDAPANGLAGSGESISLVPAGVTAGGLFWFFSAANPEMLVKVLNACAVNESFWVFYSAGTNVGLTTIVADTQASLINIYTNPNGTAAPPVQDTSTFSCASGDAAPGPGAGWRFIAAAAAPAQPAAVAASSPQAASVVPAAGGRRPASAAASASESVAQPKAGCASTATSLCIGGRYAVSVSYQSSSLSGLGQAIPLNSLGVAEGGLFWFFSLTNPEMLVKIIDGCALNDKHWVFFSAGTNVGLVVTVMDTATGQSVQYTNPNGTAAAPVQDTAALSCP